MKKILTLILGTITTFTGVFTLIILFLLANGVFNTYKFYSYKPAASSKITDKNGEVLMYVYDDQHRIPVKLEDIALTMQQATIAMEDHRFYSHYGIDPIAITRAFHSNLTEDSLQGGSTITQQYVKNAFLTPERTLTRKMKEAYLSILIESTQSKDRILESYLNQVSYGGVYNGVETAAQAYFGVSASDLSLRQSAVLASLTKAPTKYLAAYNQDLLVARQNLVLDKMVEQNFITQAEADEAKLDEIAITENPLPMKAPHFVQQVLAELDEEYTMEQISSEGMTITTSLDYTYQQKVEAIVSENVDKLQTQQVSNGAALVINSQTGEVVAWVGSKDFHDASIDGQYDVLVAKRQPGSTLKPFLYAMALEKGYTAATILNDSKTTYDTGQEEYTPVNYDSQFRGPVSIRTALGNSLNIPATRMVATLQVPNYINYLEKLSIPDIDPSNAGISIALGGYEMRPYDLATAYTALANEGELVKPRLIQKISLRNGKEEIFDRVESKRVIDASTSYIISDILSDNQARSSAFGTNSMLNIEGTKVAVKTGTSNEKRDNWAIGYTPEFVTLAWVGNSDNSPMAAVASGITGATPVWRQIQDYLIEQHQLSWYQRPTNVVEASYHKETGGKYCDKGTKATELFVKGSEPSECIEFSSATATLYEEHDGQKVKIMDLSEEDVNLFKENPFAIIEKYKDQLRADDEPTPIFIEEHPQIEDPLTRTVQAEQTDNSDASRVELSAVR